jgi:hypothetical protein
MEQFAESLVEEDEAIGWQPAVIAKWPGES